AGDRLVQPRLDPERLAAERVGSEDLASFHDHLASVLLDPAVGLVGRGLDRLGGAAEEDGGHGQRGKREAQTAESRVHDPCTPCGPGRMQGRTRITEIATSLSVSRYVIFARPNTGGVMRKVRVAPKGMGLNDFVAQ